MKKQWTTILAIVLIIIVSLFAMVNMEAVPVQFGFAAFRWPLIMVILGSLLAGALIATLISTSALFSSKKQNRESQKRIEELERKQTSQIDDVKQGYKTKIEQLQQDKDRMQQQIKTLERENKNRRAIQSGVDDEINQRPMNP